MGATERRARVREELTGEIVQAAREIVLGEGYRALTMRRIAEAIGYSAAAIYQYFENRDAIALAVMAEGFSALLEAFQPALAVIEPRARLEALARAYVGFGLDNAAMYRLMFMEDPKITKTLLERGSDPDDPGSRAYAAIIEPVAQLHAEKRLRTDVSIQAAADALWVALHGIVSLKLTCPSFPLTPTDELATATLAALLDGLSASVSRYT